MDYFFYPSLFSYTTACDLSTEGERGSAGFRHVTLFCFNTTWKETQRKLADELRQRTYELVRRFKCRGRNYIWWVSRYQWWACLIRLRSEYLDLENGSICFELPLKVPCYLEFAIYLKCLSPACQPVPPEITKVCLLPFGPVFAVSVCREMCVSLCGQQRAIFSRKLQPGVWAGGSRLQGQFKGPTLCKIDFNNNPCLYRVRKPPLNFLPFPET